MIHNLDREALSTVTTVPTTLLSHCLANCSEASVAGQQTRLPLLPHWCLCQQSHRWIPHLMKSSAILFGSVKQKVEQEPHQLPITSIKYLSNFETIWNEWNEYEMHIFDIFDPFLVSCHFLSHGFREISQKTAWVPVSILSVSILISWGGAAEHGAQNPGISTCTALRALPLPQRQFEVSTMRLLQGLEL